MMFEEVDDLGRRLFHIDAGRLSQRNDVEASRMSFHEALDEMRESGRLSEISEKYFGIDVTQEN